MMAFMENQLSYAKPLHAEGSMAAPVVGRPEVNGAEREIRSRM